MLIGPPEIYKNTGVLYVDNTILSTLATCETKVMMYYGYHLRPAHDEISAMKAGSAVHKALETHFLGGTAEEALATLETEYYEFAIANISVGDRLAYGNVVDIVRSWIWHNPLESLPYRVYEDAVEIPFDVPLTPDESIRFVGRIDLLATRTDGEGLYLIDTKSTGRIDSRFTEQFKLSSQLSGYTYAVQEMMGKAVSGIFINVVDMRSVPNGAGKCRTHGVLKQECSFEHMKHAILPFSRNPLHIKEWKRNAVRLAKQWKRMLDTQYNANYNFDSVAQSGLFKYQACSLCGLRKFCERNRRANLNEFVEEAWLPGDLGERYGN